MKIMPPGVWAFFFRFFPWPFIIAGLILLGFGLRGALRARESVHWPTAPGEIVSSSVERRHHSSTGKRRGGPTYHAEVHYDFSVDGMPYSGTRVAYGDYGSSDSAHARNIVNRYPTGKQVSVRYMPDDPEVCVLEPGVKLQAWLLAGFGLIFAGVGTAMAILFARIRPNTSQPTATVGDDADLTDRPLQE